MDMTGTQHIEAPRDVVWAALNDVEVLRQSIPGCQSIEKVSDTEMNAKVILKVGPVKATFIGKVTLSDLDPPNGYVISGKLAQLGSRLIDATSKKLAGEFFEKFGEAVAPPPETAAGEPVTPEKKKGWFRTLIKK